MPKEEIPGINDGLWDELDQGWRVVIFNKNGYVVVFETFDPFGESIETYYKVKKDNYLKAWKKIMGSGYFQKKVTGRVGGIIEIEAQISENIPA